MSERTEVNSRLTLLDLFCGPGGFSTGFDMAGFDLVGAYDYDKWAVKTFSKNHKTDAVLADLSDYDMNDMPDADVIIGGPPCTQFSSAKSNRTRNVLDGLLLVQAFLRCVYLKKPKYWIMENVPTIQKYLPESIPLSWIGIEEEGELDIPQRSELIAADYGVPQKRKRYLIGNYPLPAQTHCNDGSNTLFKLGDLQKWKTLRHALSGLPSPYNDAPKGLYKDPNYDLKIKFSDITDHFYDASLSVSEANQIKRAKTMHPYMGVLAWPDNLDEAARTVVATQLGRETLIIEDVSGGQTDYRRATVRECAAIQSFPSTYQFFGSTYGIKYRLVGDAVPPLMSYAIAKEILNAEGAFIEKPIVNKKISLHSNVLGDRIEKRKTRVNTKKKVSLMLPSKEVRGARVELYNDGFSSKEAKYKEITFCLPIWKMRLVLGEGSSTTKKFNLDWDDFTFVENIINDDMRFAAIYDDCKSDLNDFLEAASDNNELYGSHCLNEEINLIRNLSFDLVKIVDKYFPKEKYHNSYIDISERFDHSKSNKFRIRLALGIVAGCQLAKRINAHN